MTPRIKQEIWRETCKNIFSSGVSDQYNAVLHMINSTEHSAVTPIKSNWIFFLFLIFFILYFLWGLRWWVGGVEGLPGEVSKILVYLPANLLSGEKEKESCFSWVSYQFGALWHSVSRNTPSTLTARLLSLPLSIRHFLCTLPHSGKKSLDKIHVALATRTFPSPPSRLLTVSGWLFLILPRGILQPRWTCRAPTDEMERLHSNC